MTFCSTIDQLLLIGCLLTMAATPLGDMVSDDPQPASKKFKTCAKPKPKPKNKRPKESPDEDPTADFFAHFFGPEDNVDNVVVVDQEAGSTIPSSPTSMPPTSVGTTPLPSLGASYGSLAAR